MYNTQKTHPPIYRGGSYVRKIGVYIDVRDRGDRYEYFFGNKRNSEKYLQMFLSDFFDDDFFFLRINKFYCFDPENDIGAT